MSTTLPITVHASQFPENVQRGLLDSLRARRIAPKYLYETRQQARKWLALHEAFSPARTEPATAIIYDQSFVAAAEFASQRATRLVGLGCGGGQKEARLLSLHWARGNALSYTPCDASLTLVLASVRQAEMAAPGLVCHPLLCDVGAADDLAEVIDRLEARRGPRLYTFFGMIPNFEPDVILPRLAALLQAGDLLLFSANLAPGPDYAAGVERVFSGYHNRQTADWLLTFVNDLGIGPDDGRLEFSMEEASGLRRIVADFRFHQPRNLTVDGEVFNFSGGEKIRLFFSCRYTPDRVERLWKTWHFEMLGHWISPSEEEGVFFCRKT
jgi:L-histidine Nalpha-methyltransferase